MRLKVLYAMVCCVALGSGILTSDCSAAIYKYVDKDGNISISDDLQSIPEKYRKTVKIVSGEVEEKKNPIQPEQSQVQPATRQEHKVVTPEQERIAEPQHAEKIPYSSKVLISIIVAISAIFSFIILGIIDADHKKTVKIARVVIVWGVSVYLLYAHAMDIVHVFSTMGQKIESVQQKQSEKGKKAAENIRKLNALVDDLKKDIPEGSSEEAQEKK